MMREFSYLPLFAGMAFMIRGLNLVRIALQELSADRFRQMVSTLTGNRFKALLVGIGVTVVLQSSTATTVMLVGLANSGLITLVQAMGVILGADIGTAVTIQIISVNVQEKALFLIILGIFLGFIWAQSRKRKLTGEFVLGLGFIFYGMHIMSQAMLPLRENPDFKGFLTVISNAPEIVIVITAIFTFAVQSSAAVIGLALSLAHAGVMNLEVALSMVLGANVGTTGTALMAAFLGEARNQGAKQVALAHVFFKVLGTLLIYPFLGYFADATRYVTYLLGSGDSGMERFIANGHAIFNLGISILFLPFIPLAAKGFEKIFPVTATAETDDAFQVKFLDKSSLETPALAQGAVTRELLRVAEIVNGMFKESIEILRQYDLVKVEHIQRDDDRVDFLDKRIRFFIAEIGQTKLAEEQAKRQMHLLNATTALEHIGDALNDDIVKLAKKMNQKGVKFSHEGWEEIQDFHAKVNLNFNLAISAFADRSGELARKVLRNVKNLEELEGQLKQNHLARLQSGLKESFDTSTVHLEILSELKRINSLLTQFAIAVLETEKTM